MEVEELERTFRRLAEEKESIETPRLLEQTVNLLSALSKKSPPGSVPAQVVNNLHQEDPERFLLHTLHESSLRRQQRQLKLTNLL